MSLNPYQRLVLANQFRILATLDDHEAEGYGRFVEILENGYEWHYSDFLDPILEPLKPEECREVVKIMDMFRALRRGYDQMTDKLGVAEWQVTFAGFDGNNETRLLTYAKFYHNNGERFEELKGMDFNSHSPSIEWYRRMLNVWESLGRKPFLSPEEVVSITRESIHPENRTRE